jgi:hypothetical protein
MFSRARSCSWSEASLSVLEFWHGLGWNVCHNKLNYVISPLYSIARSDSHIKPWFTDSFQIHVRTYVLKVQLMCTYVMSAHLAYVLIVCARHLPNCGAATSAIAMRLILFPDSAQKRAGWRATPIFWPHPHKEVEIYGVKIRKINNFKISDRDFK